MKPTRQEYLRQKKREWTARNPERAAQHNVDKLAREKAAREAKWSAIAKQTRVTLHHHAYYTVLHIGHVKQRLQFDADTQTFTRAFPPCAIALGEVERIAVYLTPQARTQGAQARWFDLDDVYLARKAA